MPDRLLESGTTLFFAPHRSKESFTCNGRHEQLNVEPIDDEYQWAEGSSQSWTLCSDLLQNATLCPKVVENAGTNIQQVTHVLPHLSDPDCLVNVQLCTAHCPCLCGS